MRVKLPIRRSRGEDKMRLRTRHKIMNSSKIKMINNNRRTSNKKRISNKKMSNRRSNNSSKNHSRKRNNNNSNNNRMLGSNKPNLNNPYRTLAKVNIPKRS
jgi:hypothetical protein